ncbi:hypothetical protein CBP51_16350 [Cellvibrio mixtus]|uniref:Glycosyl hydrolase family 98 putative carbohydrate-binding module domain-containing protein n=1 Tax=Cellvibrio mixtus TaxID=39650 RepID=A0A266Q4E1_9GAMM|nr:NPCBM/NEW2 domain-containing protein [Cellvibrio mixtus]OZY84738.1 hypothetical protein CBP51_16350 [Cellvibrio mixtus]
MNSPDLPPTKAAIEPLTGFSAFSNTTPYTSARLLQSYLMLVIILNFSLLFLKGYSQDLGYWQDWVRQLSTSGYDGFNGNYPPVYIHWLYLVGKFYSLTAIPLEHNDLLKFLTQIPVTLFHCILTFIVFRQLQTARAKPSLLQAVMVLTVFNPAILVNGPIWGQIDLIPAVMVYGSLLAANSWRYTYLAIPLFALALLTKFQTIAFAPIFGFLFFNKTRQHIIGILLAVLLGIVIFMPSIIAGHFWQSFRQAYIDTLGQYPMTTFNAANLWILLTGNTAPDNIVLFGVAQDSALARIFMAKHFGMMLFAITSLGIFIHGICFLIKNNTYINSNQLLSYSLFAATICALAFFTLLPAMHERYLFPATVIALGYCAIARQKVIYPVLISIICALNMLIILEINGSDIWYGLSWLTVGILIVALLDHLTNHKVLTISRVILKRVGHVPFASFWFFMLASTTMMFYFYDRYHIHQIELSEKQILLTDLPLIYARQDHGKMAVNRSFDGNRLSVANRRYAQGIGTHASSDIQYQLPDNAETFSFMAALDDEVGTADVQFSVWGDGKLLWQSAIIYGYERHIPTYKLDIRGVKMLNLKVASLKDERWDHANWINTVITLATVAAQDK